MLPGQCVLRNDLDPRHRMDLCPTIVCIIEHERAGDGDARSGWREGDRIAERFARRSGVGLLDRIPANDFEDEISVLVSAVAVVDQVGEGGIDVQPAVYVAIGFVTYAVTRRVRARRGRVDEGPGHRDAAAQNDQALRMVNVLPETIAAAGELVRPGYVEIPVPALSGDRDEEDGGDDAESGHRDREKDLAASFVATFGLNRRQMSWWVEYAIRRGRVR